MGSDLLLETYLKRLRLPTVAANYRRFAQEATHGNQPYERYLLALLETEVHHQEANSERKRIVQARFPVLKTLDEFQFAAIPGLNRQAILELAQSNYIQPEIPTSSGLRFKGYYPLSRHGSYGNRDVSPHLRQVRARS